MLKNILTPLLKSAFDDPRSPLHQRNPSNCSIPETVDDDSIAEDFAYDVRVEIIRRTVEQLKSTSDITAHRDVSVVGTRRVLRKYPGRAYRKVLTRNISPCVIEFGTDPCGIAAG